jgi:DNA-binding SARP family transcriptional activator
VGALGPLVLERAGEPLVLRRRKARELFLYLLLSRSQPATVDAIADALWEGRPPHNYAHVVSAYASVIRTTLGWSGEHHGRHLSCQHGRYTLRVEEDGVDFVRFEALLTHASRAMVRGAPVQAIQEAEAAMSLIRGDPLTDVADRTFAASEVARLSELYTALQEMRAWALLDLGKTDQVIADLTGLVEEQPHRERLTGLLTVAMYRARRQVEALELAQAFCRRRKAEYGEPPSQRFLDLELAMLTQAPDLGTAEALRQLLAPPLEPH